MSITYPDSNWPGDQQFSNNPPNVTGSNSGSAPSGIPYQLDGGNPNWPGNQQKWPPVGGIPSSTASVVISSSMYR
jgi:hypothetical protein